jgi:hypothetical protein
MVTGWWVPMFLYFTACPYDFEAYDLYLNCVYIFEMASNQSHNPGEFREGHTRELVLEDVTVDAFDVMMRTAYHLEPKLTPPRAISTLKAAKLYMIEDL